MPEERLVRVPLDIPPVLLEPVPKPNRPLHTYKDAVIRDRERGAAIDQANAKIESIARIQNSQAAAE